MNNRRASIGDVSATYPSFYAKPVQSMHYTVTLTDDIDKPSVYDDLVALLLQSEEEDTIDLIINTSGGYLDSFWAIRNALGLTAATVTGYLLGSAHSAGSAIFLSCHNYLVGQGSAMMIHAPSYGASGKSKDVAAQVEFATKENERFVRVVYDNFLTPKEIDEVIAGREIWLNQEEISERLADRAGYEKKEITS